ncbi:MAG: GGDEF domain-containing protein [Longimicrobiales bacterium]|nr:GGDEF domain-containing protein [Longimicrobiales bacterium]
MSTRALQALIRRLQAAPPAVVAALGLLGVGLLGLADVATGEEISSSVFYTLPVGITAWYAGARWGAALCVLAAGTWYEADIVAGATYSAAWIPFWNAGVRLAFFVIIANLLARQRRILEAQRALAEVDALTGLANSRRFLAVLEAEVARSARYRRPVSLAYFDLDGFKGVNDRLGHLTGDELLAAVGRALREQVRKTDLPARLGGDEFAVLFPETDAAAVRDAMDHLRSRLQDTVDARGWPVGFSAGVFTSTGEIKTGEELIRRADEVMYEVKRSGKGGTTYRTTLAGP